MEVHIIRDLEQLKVLADPFRLKLLEQLVEQRLTVKQLADRLGEVPAKVYYHVKELERVGLIKLVKTQEKGGILEKYYQAVAKDFRIDRSFPLAREEDREALKQTALSVLQQLMEELETSLHQQSKLPEPMRKPITLKVQSVKLDRAQLEKLQHAMEKLLEELGEGVLQGLPYKVAFLAYPQHQAEGNKINEERRDHNEAAC